MPAPHRTGFATHDPSVEATPLEVEGSLPAWLEGTLLRNGPGLFDVGERTVNHWFDGLAVLHSFTIRQGTVTYASRPLESQAYQHAAEHGELSVGEFATDPCRSIFERFFSLFSRETTDNANVNLARMAGRYVAMTETPMSVVVDPETLETEGRLAWQDDVDGQVTTAHPHHDPAQGLTYNYVAHLARKSSYRIVQIPDGTARREVLAEHAVDEPAYMHSFGMTERFLVLTEFPLVVDPLDLALSSDPFIENYRWTPDRGTRILVFDRASGDLVAHKRTEPMFAFHHVNAYEEDGEIVCDLATYPDAGLIDELMLKNLRGREPTFTPGQLRRLRIPLDDGPVRSTTILDETFDLPRIRYGERNARPYRYAYGIGATDGGASLWDKLTKVDVTDGSTSTWHEPGCVPGEPVFVSAPDASGEDEGLVLSVVLDTDRSTSMLLVLDAETFEERARAWTPRPVALGFHGQFAPSAGAKHKE